jgi:hypothetical protein
MTCHVCENIDPALSDRANALALNIGKSTVHDHKKANHNASTDVDSFFGVPNAIITCRGKTTRLVDGSYEKITWQPNKAALLESLSYDDIELSIADYTSVHEKTNTSKVTSVLNMTDLQIGKASQRGGGTPETIERVMNSFYAFAAHVRLVNPEHIILVDGGDSVEGIFNVPSQKHTNDLDLSAQIRTFRRLAIEGIKILAPLAPKFTYLSVPSNHGAVRDSYGSQAGNVDADFGLDINYQLEDVFADHKYLSGIEFVRPESMYNTAVITSSNTKLAFNHGHLSKGQNGHHNWWAAQDHGRMPGWDADIMVFGHYHNLKVEQSGDERWIIGVSSSEPSSDWFADASGQAATRGMTMFDVSNGVWQNLQIL